MTKVKELLYDTLPIISKFAPSLASAVGGPLGFAMGYIIPILANAFGAHPTNIPELVDKILKDPDAKDKLQELETEHGEWIDQLINSVHKLSKAELHVNLEWQNSDGKS